MPSKETLKKEPSALSRKVTRAWKRGKGWSTLPSRARKPLTKEQARRAFYGQAFQIDNLLSIIRRLYREGNTAQARILEKEAVMDAQALAREMNSHAITRALRANRVLDPKIKTKIRWAMHQLNTNPSMANARVQNARMEEVLGKKFNSFAEDYNRNMATIPIQVRSMLTYRQPPMRTVFVARPSPFARVQKIFRRKQGRRTG